MRTRRNRSRSIVGISNGKSDQPISSSPSARKQPLHQQSSKRQRHINSNNSNYTNNAPIPNTHHRHNNNNDNNLSTASSCDSFPIIDTDTTATLHFQPPSTPTVPSKRSHHRLKPRVTMISMLSTFFLAILFNAWMTPAYLYNNQQLLMYWDRDVLEMNKAAISVPGLSQRSFAGLLKSLRATCESILANNTKIVYSVVAKNETATSGDKHDYLSLARYYWPDPSKPNGIPYIRKDGEVNPEVQLIPDFPLFKLLLKNVKALSVGYFYLDEPRYAAEVVRMVKQWFLDQETYMTPRLQYASVVRGYNNDTGRNQGCLDFKDLHYLFDALALISDSGLWTMDDEMALRDWFSKYLDWLWFSLNGGMERNMPNNHGTWYRVQLMAVSLYVNRTDLGAWAAQDITNEIDFQMDTSQGDDSAVLTYEIIRAASFHYSAYAVGAYLAGARLALNFGLDILAYRGSNSQSVNRALDALVPHYLNNGTDWPYPKLAGFAQLDLSPVLKDAHVLGMENMRGTPYIEAVNRVQPRVLTHNIDRLFAPVNAFDSPKFNRGRRVRGGGGVGGRAAVGVLIGIAIAGWIGVGSLGS
ncbi:hypothetical protein HDU76_002108 [Blyttiomyces sp. JEL0837]|nr:hypothetical protein HDU76_002108 [Blyttiomyces sp. JEL0837]